MYDCDIQEEGNNHYFRKIVNMYGNISYNNIKEIFYYNL